MTLMDIHQNDGEAQLCRKTPSFIRWGQGPRWEQCSTKLSALRILNERKSRSYKNVEIKDKPFRLASEKWV